MIQQPRFSREELSDAMFKDSTTTTMIRYEMQKLVDKYPNIVETLAEAKD